MSRARRLPRHRRIPTVSKVTLPVAVGGAVAAVAVTATPLADALNGKGSDTRSGDGAPDVVMVAPATASPHDKTDRASRGQFRPQPGAAASAAPHIRLGDSDLTSASANGGDGSDGTDEDPTTAGTASSSSTEDPTTSDDPPNGNGTPPTAPPGHDPTHKVVLPLPTLSTTSLPTLLPSLTPEP